MSLKNKIDEQIKTSMLNKDKDRLRGLRAIKSLILLAETETGNKQELSEDEEIKILNKAAKQRRDSIEIYEKQGRNDLLQVERQELDIIQEFLPKQLSESEVETIIREIIKEVGASQPSDMGKVMGAANKKMSGKADGKTISEIVKKLLNQ